MNFLIQQQAQLLDRMYTMAQINRVTSSNMTTSNININPQYTPPVIFGTSIIHVPNKVVSDVIMHTQQVRNEQMRHVAKMADLVVKQPESKRLENGLKNYIDELNKSPSETLNKSEISELIDNNTKLMEMNVDLVNKYEELKGFVNKLESENNLEKLLREYTKK